MEFGQKLMQMVSTGLSNFGPQVGAELGRLGVQGTAELGSGLFAESNFYVAYGAGQIRDSGVHGKEGLLNEGQEIQHEHDGRSM